MIGIFTGVAMMTVSYLMDGYGMLEQSQALMARPLYIYTLCMILGMIGVPAMCFAWSAWYEMVLEISPKSCSQTDSDGRYKEPIRDDGIVWMVIVYDGGIPAPEKKRRLSRKN